jgi:hypothetical protein
MSTVISGKMFVKRRKKLVDSLCYLKFALTNSYKHRKEQQRQEDRRRKHFQRKRKEILKIKAESANRLIQMSRPVGDLAGENFANRKVYELKKELTAAIKNCNNNLSPGELRKKIWDQHYKTFLSVTIWPKKSWESIRKIYYDFSFNR